MNICLRRRVIRWPIFLSGIILGIPIWKCWQKEYQETVYNDVSDKPQVIVVGAGPGGLFAALRLIELGLRPVIVERGKNVRDRKKDLALIGREQTVNPESNYSFGEGGAGAYSDGKL